MWTALDIPDKCNLTSDMISIAERIRRWRENREDLSKADLARSVGVTRQAWQQWEAGATLPTHANVEKIAEAVGVSLPVFWGAIPKARQAKAS